MFSYHDLKTGLYCALTLIGVLLIGMAFHLANTSNSFANTLSYDIAAFIVLAVGCILVFFGYETYLLRDDPDIWR